MNSDGNSSFSSNSTARANEAGELGSSGSPIARSNCSAKWYGLECGNDTAIARSCASIMREIESTNLNRGPSDTSERLFVRSRTNGGNTAE